MKYRRDHFFLFLVILLCCSFIYLINYIPYELNKNSNVRYEDFDLFLSNSVAYEWNQTWNDDSEDKWPTDIAIDSQNNIYVTGYFINPVSSSWDIFLVKFDSSGDPLWNREWGGPYEDKPHGIVIDSLDNIIIVGDTHQYSDDVEELGDICLLKYDSLGNLVGEIIWGETSTVILDNPLDVCVDSFNNIYVVAVLDRGISLIKFDSLGNEEWVIRDYDPIDSSSRGYKIDADSNDNVYIVGYYLKSGNRDAWLLKFNSSGNLQWNRTWGGIALEVGHDLAIDSSNYIYITGETRSFPNGKNKIFLAKFDDLGNHIWNNTSGGGINDESVAIAIDSSNRIYITGVTPVIFNSLPRDNIILLQYNNSGYYLSRHVWGWDYIDEPVYDIAIDLLDNVFLLGDIYGDVLLLKYGIDTDLDGICDWNEINIYSTDPMKPDTDFDYLSDGLEVNNYGTNPLLNDTDSDGLLDGMEVFNYGTNPLNDDTDSDGLSDGLEINFYNTEPLLGDTDFDGLLDGLEINLYYTNPLLNDTDSDGLLDGIDEVNNYGTNPLLDDTDSDGLVDGIEVFNYSTNPLNDDTDSDGLLDGLEVNIYYTNPLLGDTDSDGMSDGWEIDNSLNPLINDSALDPDFDQLTNLEEYYYNTDPNNPDTDGDNWNDLDEINRGTDPTDPNDFPIEAKNAIPGFNLYLVISLVLVILSRLFKKYKQYHS